MVKTQCSSRGRPGHKKTNRFGLTAKYTAEYKAWHAMIQRCENPAYKNYRLYGGRGISVCDLWKGSNGFSEFLSHVGPRPAEKMSIDRIDVNGNYEPGNVRWADNKTQSNNKRNNHNLTFNGKTQTVRMWSEEIGINEQTLHERLKDWSVEKSLTTPLRRPKRKPR